MALFGAMVGLVGLFCVDCHGFFHRLFHGASRGFAHDFCHEKLSYSVLIVFTLKGSKSGL